MPQNDGLSAWRKRVISAQLRGLTPAMIRNTATPDDYLDSEAFIDYGEANAYWVNLVGDSGDTYAMKLIVQLEYMRVYNYVEWNNNPAFKRLKRWRTAYLGSSERSRWRVGKGGDSP